MLKRILAVILVCMFLPVFAFGEAFHYSLSFSSVGAPAGSPLEGVLDFLEMLKGDKEEEQA